MEAGSLKPPDPGLRGSLVSALNRWVALGVGLLALVLLWDSPKVRRLPALVVAASYLLYHLSSQTWARRRSAGRTLKVLQAVVDALAVGLAAAFSGGLESPVWLLLYPHAVAVSVRGGLSHALPVGLMDALIVTLLARMTPSQPLGGLHALALLWCAFAGGIMSSYLKRVRQRLTEANRELEAKNLQLSETVGAHEATRREQERALARLKDSEERYRRLLERIQDGVLIIQEGRIVYANQVFAEMAGESPESLAGADFRDLVPPEDRQGLAERYERWEQSQAVSGAFESRLRTRGRDTLLVSVKAGSVEFEGKRSVVATVRDVTRARRMEEEVRGHAERLAVLNEIANAVNLSLTMENILRVAAEETRQLVPFDRLTLALLEEEEAGVEVVAVGPGTARRRASVPRSEVAWAFKRPTIWCQGGEGPGPPHLQELLAGPGVLSAATLPLLSKDRVVGSMNLGRTEAEPFSTWDLAVAEPVARHIAIALDNARLLEAVRRRGREFESLFEVGRRIVERLELREILPLIAQSVNRLMGTHFCLLLLREGDKLVFGAHEGLEPEVIEALRSLKVGQSLTGWVAREGRPLAVEDMRADPRSGFKRTAKRFGYRSYLCVPLRVRDSVLGTLEVVTKEPRRFRPEEQELMAAFAAEAAVAIDHARLFAATRSHLAQLEEAHSRLQDLNRMREEYLRNVSHEFRTPLTVIRGYAEYLEEPEAHDPQSLQEVVRVIVESCDRLIDLVDTLLEVSRIEQGVAEEILHVREVDLREVVAHSVEGLTPLAARKGIAVDLVLPGEPVRVQGDNALLHQVVRKLVDNALKYSRSGSRVVVRARGDGEQTQLEVEDSGIGITAEHLPRIFEKFYVVDGGIARRAGGAGVGLYLVREIVRLHHGAIDVRSDPGQGSVFCVRLPRHFPASRPRAAQA